MIIDRSFSIASLCQRLFNILKTSTFYEHLVVFSIVFLLPLAVSLLTRDIYTIIKWKMVHLLVIFALFQLGFIHRCFTFPKINKLFLIACFGILGLWAFDYYFHHIPFVSEVTTDRIGFVVLTLFFLHLFKKSPQTIDTLSYALILSMTCFAGLILFQGIISLPEFFQGTPMHTKLQHTFGNPNMAAQFFGFALLATFRMIFLKKPIFLKALFSLLFLFFSLFLIKTGCRSVMIGVGLGSVFYSVMQLKTYRKSLLISGFVAGLIALPFLFLLRPQTVQHRLDMWQNAIHIAKDYPLGVGRGKFGFYHVLYQEQDQVSPRSEGLIERTPHNEIFKYLAEEGWAYVLMIFVLLGSFLYVTRLDLASSFKTNEKTQMVGAFALLLIVESLMQFPFELALPYLMISVVLGYLFSLAPRQNSSSWPFSVLVSIPLLGIFGTISWFLWRSDLAHGIKRFDAAFVQEACTRTPYAWRTCDLHTGHLLQQKRSEEAIESLLTHLALRPYNFLNLYKLGHAYMMSGQKDLTCKFAWFHDRLFDHKSRLHQFVVEECPQQEQEFLLALPLKDHYRGLFSHVSREHQKKISHNT